MIFRDFEQKIVKDINESEMPIDAIYFIMKSIIREIEEKYVEYCRLEDAAATQEANEESGSEDIKTVSANNKGTN